jgi:hypothetical protein
VVVASPANPNVIPKEARLRNLPGTNLPLKQKRARSFIAGDSRLPAGQVSSFDVGMTKKEKVVVEITG